MSDEKHIDVQYIETEVPVPVRHTYPFDSLKVGESFLFPVNKRNSVQARASRIKKATGKTFTIKKIESGQCRIWRTK